MRRFALYVVLAAALATAAPAAQTSRTHFMWAVRQAGAPPTYLVGSLHVLTPEYYPLDPALEKAFGESKVLIEEVDLDELTNPMTALALVSRAMLTDGRTLDQLISADLYKQVVTRAEKAGLPAIALQQMERHALRTFGADAGKATQRFDQLGKKVGFGGHAQATS